VTPGLAAGFRHAYNNPGVDVSETRTRAWRGAEIPAGGGTDVVARMVADHLSKLLNQPIFVENRGGANGAVGLEALKQSDADGYTLGFTSDTPMTVNPWLYKDLAYDPLKDFVPIATAVRLPGMLAANPSLTFSELKELLHASDGNLSVHARKLEDAGYVACTKSFAGRMPRTEYRLTASGRRALEKYLDHMEALIRATREA